MSVGAVVDVAASSVRCRANAGMRARRHGTISSHTPECRLRFATKTFKCFRKNPDYVGLAGAVSMTFVRGKYGAYDAGSMFVFPWLKPKAQDRYGSGTMLPVSSTQSISSEPIPDATLPLDEYFCNYRLQAPTPMFIGFHVDVPHSPVEGRFDWFSNVRSLPTERAWASTGPAAI